ncbi:MAG: VWA domain-containing protein [Deltaproteobacteria bacterium]|nr:VWA domain-containing protein [Deltaproteobacteria bacterium]
MNIHTIFARKRYAQAVAGGAIALSAAGIVLLRAEVSQRPVVETESINVTPGTATQAPRAEFRGPAAHGSVALSQGAIATAGMQHVFAEVRITADQVANAAIRPVAMAVVLDVSGSMSGEKLEQAKRSVLQLVERMRDTDQIALVTYSDSARVIQPLAPLSVARAALQMTIPTIAIEGGTNIPAGLGMGAMALGNAAQGFVRRIVLVSDGQDTSGRPLEQVRAEVRGRADAGFTVSTLGIGVDYSEPTMTALADAGRGNYEFLRTGAELASFLTRELDQANRTTVERATAEVTLPAGWRLDRAVGTEAQGTSGTLVLPVGALFAGDERRIVLDLVAPASAAGAVHSLAVRANWHAVQSNQDVRVGDGQLAIRATDSQAEVVASVNAEVMAQSQSALLAVRQREAVEAWRSGDAQRAQAITASNIVALRALQANAPSAAPALARQAAAYADESESFGNVSAGSAEGRAQSLGFNARHRRAAMRSAAY